MKNFFKSLMLVAVAAMAFTACQNDVDDVNAVSKGTTFTFTVGFNEDTRVAFSENQNKYNALWEDGDEVVFVAPVANGDYAYEAKFVEAVVLNNGKNAEFTVKFDGEVIPGEIKAYMGTVEQDWDAYDGSYTIKENWSAWQQPKENAPEYVSSVATFAYDGLNVTGNLVFEHYYAYGLVTIADDIAYDKVELKFTYDYVDSYDGNTYPTSTTISLNSDKKNMWFYVKEIDVVNYVEVVAHTDAGTYSKKFDLTERANPLSFNAGVVSKFTVKGLEKDPVMLPAPVVTAKVENLTNVTVEWSAVENAATYELSINSEEVELSAEQIAARKYTFNGEYNTGYTFYVYAVPEEDSTEYLKSDYGYAYVKTDANPNPTIVTYTVAKVIKNGSDMTVDLSDGNGHNFVATFWNINGDVLPAGVYNIGMHFSNYGLTFNGEQIWGDYAGNDMVVTVTDDKLVITVTWYGEKFECTYNGQIAVDANVMPSLYLYGVWDHIKTVTEYGIMYNSDAHLYSVSSYEGIDISKGLGVVFRNDAWDWFSLVFDTNGLKSIPVGEYTVGSNVSGFAYRETLKTGTVTVAYDEATGYTITCDVASNSYSYKGEFVGAIYDLAAPGEGGVVEPTIPTYEFVNAIVSRVGGEYGYTDFDVQFKTAAGDTLQFDFYSCQTDAKANFIPEGIYQIAENGPAIYTRSFSKVTFGGVEYALEGGSVTVEEVDGKYRFTMNEVSYGYYNSYTSVYSNLAKFNGSFVGEIEGLVVPSEYVAPDPVVPEPGDAVELKITSHAVTNWYGGGEAEIFFYDEDGGNHLLDMYFPVNGVISAGTFSTDKFVLQYCKYMYGSSEHGGGVVMSSANAVVTDNGGDSFTFDVTFVANSVTYHFTYTGSF